MRRVLQLIFVAASLCACSKQLEYDSGELVSRAFVTAAAGNLPVLVTTTGVWRVKVASDSPWVSLDVPGGVGKGAFTIYYKSNETGIESLNPARTAAIVVSSDEYNVSDTLMLVQQGFRGNDVNFEVREDPRIILEPGYTGTTTLNIVYVCCDGAEKGKVVSWAREKGFDYVLTEDGVQFPETLFEEISGGGRAKLSTIDGTSIITADFSTVENRHDAFVNVLSNSYNSLERSVKNWIIAGSFYHYSMMQTGYPDTPQWYPGNPEDSAFDTDRFAWNNNLFDPLWLSERKFITTWTDPSGRSWAADYIYVSKTVLGGISAVGKLDPPFEGMTHNPIYLTLKF